MLYWLVAVKSVASFPVTDHKQQTVPAAKTNKYAQTYQKICQTYFPTPVHETLKPKGDTGT